MQKLKQAWWAPLAAVLAVAQVWIAMAFIYGEGTSNLLDAESTAAGMALSLAGAAALVTGLWVRPKARGVGNTLVIVGAVLAALWVWIVFMVPLAIMVVVGVVVTQVRADSPVVETT